LVKVSSIITIQVEYGAGNKKAMNNILVPVYRNLIAATDKIFLIWRVAFPAVYIFVVGYAYSALIGDRGIVAGSLSITYTSFIAAGMIGFNVMNASGIADSIISYVNDISRRYDTLSQLNHYVWPRFIK
jgi:hypothetical protein